MIDDRGSQEMSTMPNLDDVGMAESLADEASPAVGPGISASARIDASGGASLGGGDLASGKDAPRSSLERAFEKAEFAPFGEKPRQAGHSNIDLLLDVPLPITVELGKTSMTIRDILDLGPGSVVELDKVAGEPVDILVNGKLVAKGEVVVIDENFGVRVVDIIAPAERLSAGKA